MPSVFAEEGAPASLPVVPAFLCGPYKQLNGPCEGAACPDYAIVVIEQPGAPPEQRPVCCIAEARRVAIARDQAIVHNIGQLIEIAGALGFMGEDDEGEKTG